MLGRLFNARLKSAEQALADGRIDEAFRLTTAPDLAQERRATAVREQVGQLLFARAEAHYQAGRSVEALNDLDRAEQAGVAAQRVADLRLIVRAAVEDAQSRQHSRRQRIEAAQRFLADGSLRSAEQVLEDAAQNDPDANHLRRVAADREQRAGELFAEVRQYIDDRHPSAAIERFRRARQLNLRDPRVPELERVLVDGVVASVRQSLAAGKLNLALEEWALLRGIGDQCSAKTDLAAAVETVVAAHSALRAGDYEQARRKVLGLEHLLGNPKWLKQAGEQLRLIDEQITRLHGGPLGLISDARVRPGAVPRSAGPPLGGVDLVETLAVPQAPEGDSLLPERLLMLVDGSGSYLLIRNPRASVGRAATDQPADIPIVSDLSARHAEFARVDDDYFIFARREVSIDGRAVRHKLLQHDDKLVLGTRARLTFKLPSRKSTSAILDLSGSCKLPNDVKRVVLFDRFATLGRRSNAHVVVPSASEDVLLYERGGKLWVRHKANGRGDDGEPIELGKPFEYAGVSMVIEPWSVKV